MTATDVLFQPFVSPRLSLPNRIVMAPMTRNMAPGGVPGQTNADYYRRRAEGGVGLILSEGTVVDRPASRNAAEHSAASTARSRSAAGSKVIDAVHAAGGKMGPQIWHIGAVPSSDPAFERRPALDSPSGLDAAGAAGGRADERRSDRRRDRRLRATPPPTPRRSASTRSKSTARTAT